VEAQSLAYSSSAAPDIGSTEKANALEGCAPSWVFESPTGQLAKKRSTVSTIPQSLAR
jgi:hypothetical protein